MGSPGDPAALAALEEGQAAFLARNLDAAHAAFGRAFQRGGRDPRLLSWYGVTLVLVEKNSNLGVQLCDQALRAGGLDPELLLNLARVHLALHQRDRVVQVVARGLELWPDDPRLLAARAALGNRRDPVLPFLARGSPLNVLLGRLRHRWRARRGPVQELSPETLGVPPAPPPAEDRS
jgi:tetratricopeptide (TPR) repeat protein